MLAVTATALESRVIALGRLSRAAAAHPRPEERAAPHPEALAPHWDASLEGSRRACRRMGRVTAPAARNALGHNARKAVLTHHKTAIELRAEKICSHSTVLRALGGLGLELMKVDNWRERLAALDDIDWSKKNPDWENVCIIANSVVSNRQARAATKAYIKAKLSMELTESEQRSLEKKAA
jgi:DNA-sulfur modification-associated